MNSHAGIVWTGKRWVEYSPGWTEPYDPEEPGAAAGRQFVQALKAWETGDFEEYDALKESIGSCACWGRWWRMLEAFEGTWEVSE